MSAQRLNKWGLLAIVLLPFSAQAGVKCPPGDFSACGKCFIQGIPIAPSCAVYGTQEDCSLLIVATSGVITRLTELTEKQAQAYKGWLLLTGLNSIEHAEVFCDPRS